MFWGSAAMVVGAIAFMWGAFAQQKFILLFFPGAPFLAIGIFGIVVSVFGCEECVAKFFGEL